MHYELTANSSKKEKIGFLKALKSLYKFLKDSKYGILAAFGFLLINSASTIVAPFLIGDVTNKYIPVGDRDNLLRSLIIIAIVYIVGTVASYFQILIMGKVGQSILFRVRNAIFQKIQELPLQFFNVNKSGDLISRINNDTEKLNQAFSETLLRFTGDIVVLIGVGIAMLIINPTLGIIAFIALAVMLAVTFLAANWIKVKNDQNLQKLGELSAEIQESLTNFKVTVVFNRRNYFREAFAQVNENNRKAATWAGIANGVLLHIYKFAGSVGSLLILVFGIQLFILDKIASGSIPEVGTLITFMLYSNAFFNPLKELGELSAQLQTGIASWSRINKILRLESNLKVIKSNDQQYPALLMKFNNVSFGYDVEELVLQDVNIELEEGKTYALVGPTGGGKSTAASLMARLYDVSAGQIFFRGKDIRSYTFDELASEIGFILQEPFLFTGTLAENIQYGNDKLTHLNENELEAKLKDLGLERLVARFKEGLKTEIQPGAENISLGQRQLIAFVRILLREPSLLILDEATANVDTVTEQLLEEILRKLPAQTTKVIIAHRLNTIENADQIFFISGGKIEKPIDFASALNLINSAHRLS